jgi:hypothetical protein
MKTAFGHVRWTRHDASRRLCGRALHVLATAIIVGVCAAARADEAPPASQSDFASPEQASEALMSALRENEQQRMLEILGPDGQKLVQSGDPVADRNARQRLVGAYDTTHRVSRGADNRATLIVGTEDWSLPIPIVRQGQRWRFDTEASMQTILDRRVGRNELSVIEVCRAFVTAQRQFAMLHPLGKHRREYAARFNSHPGKQDGLYWEAGAGQPQSPLGPLVARARAEGYEAEEPVRAATPYHGYYYRILTRQGAHAPGGAKDYQVEGHLSGGFALLAFPAKWGDSGVMSFIVNQDGIVFEKNLGPDTDRLARGITQFDPDLDWRAP